MPTTLSSAIDSNVRARNLSQGTRNEYLATLRKWEWWGDGGRIEELTRKQIREFLDWVHEDAIRVEGANPDRTTNKSRENLRAVATTLHRPTAVELQTAVVQLMALGGLA